MSKRQKKTMFIVLGIIVIVPLLWFGLDGYYKLRFHSQCEKITWGDTYATFNCHF